MSPTPGDPPDATSRGSHTHPATPPSIGGVPVRDLLAQLRAGQRDALSTLYKGLFEELWHIAAIETHSRDRATDIVHDVFLWLWTRHETILDNTDIRVYLAVAVRNRARSLSRHIRVVDRVTDAAESAETTAGRESAEPLAMGQPVSPADTIVEANEFRTAYNRAIATLTDQERLAVFLRWEEEWSFEQIGQVLSLSKVGARKVVLRAQQKVQALLAAFRG